MLNFVSVLKKKERYRLTWKTNRDFFFFPRLDKPINDFDKRNDTNKISDARLKKFVHQLSSLEQQLRTMEAKIYLCSEDVRQLNTGKSIFISTLHFYP